MYERLAQGKQISSREERELFAFNGLLDSFEELKGASQLSLLANLCHSVIAQPLAALSSYVDNLTGNFALHLVLDNHVIAIYRTSNSYAYFDSNVTFVRDVSIAIQLIQLLIQAISTTGYQLPTADFSAEHFDMIKANKALSSTQKQSLTQPIETEYHHLSLQDQERGLFSINYQSISRVSLYDLGTRLQLEGSAPILINADMGLRQENLI